MRPLIIHVVAWAFRGDVGAAQVTAQNDALARGREIPGVRSMALGPNVTKGDKDNGYAYGYVATFDTIDALAKFQDHPIHKTAADSFVALTSQIMTLDIAAEKFESPPAERPCARHVVMWSFKDGAGVEDRHAVLAMVKESRSMPQVRALAVGPNLGRSLRGEGHTHLAVYTFDDASAIETYRSEPVFHPRLGNILRRHTAQLTVMDIEG